MNRRQLLLGSSALVAAAAMPAPLVLESTEFSWQAGLIAYPYIQWTWDAVADQVTSRRIAASEVYT